MSIISITAHKNSGHLPGSEIHSSDAKFEYIIMPSYFYCIYNNNYDAVLLKLSTTILVIKKSPLYFENFSVTCYA